MSMYRSCETSCLISSIGNSGARSAGPIGCLLPGCMGGLPGKGRSAWMVYQRVGISRSSSTIRVAAAGASILMGLLLPWSLGFSMDGTPPQRLDPTAMLAALERLVGLQSPSLDKTRCDACADQGAGLFLWGTGAP